MTETSISLLSILSGICGALLFGWIFQKYSHGLTGNVIVGVFGGGLLLKLIARVNLGPISIMQSGEVHPGLLILCVLLTLFGGALAVFISAKLKARFS